MRDIVMKPSYRSTYVWELKDRNCPFRISWSIVKRTTAYSAGSRSCNLCDSEKLCILKATKNDILNKRSGIYSQNAHSKENIWWETLATQELTRVCDPYARYLRKQTINGIFSCLKIAFCKDCMKL